MLCQAAAQILLRHFKNGSKGQQGLKCGPEATTRVKTSIFNVILALGSLHLALGIIDLQDGICPVTIVHELGKSSDVRISLNKEMP